MDEVEAREGRFWVWRKGYPPPPRPSRLYDKYADDLVPIEREREALADDPDRLQRVVWIDRDERCPPSIP
jgi:hypothetical protein